jgi:hypothetical protein
MYNITKQDLAALAKAHEFDVIYDMNGRELSDTKPLADAYKGRVCACVRGRVWGGGGVCMYVCVCWGCCVLACVRA